MRIKTHNVTTTKNTKSLNTSYDAKEMKRLSIADNLSIKTPENALHQAPCVFKYTKNAINHTHLLTSDKMKRFNKTPVAVILLHDILSRIEMKEHKKRREEKKTNTPF